MSSKLSLSIGMKSSNEIIKLLYLECSNDFKRGKRRKRYIQKKGIERIPYTQGEEK